jgi:hypothetical protein
MQTRAISDDTGYIWGCNASERDEESYQIRCVVRRDVGVAAGAIYDVIVNRAGGDSDVMISFRQIAGEAGVSVRTVRRGIERLCDSGWLKRQPPQTAEGGGPRLSTWFTMPAVREAGVTDG